MGTILDDLVGRIDDEALRAQIAEQIATLEDQKNYGLVFPRHLPETVRLPNHPVRRRVAVTLRDGSTEEVWAVKRIRADEATVVDRAGAEQQVPVSDLVVVRRFGDPVFPGLVSVGKVETAEGQPWNIAINAENYHALEALTYTCAGQVDVIYCDPPYNTGATDWKYNNDYVDSNDVYRHSKWLSFMERRLVLARRLLKHDSVLVVTIDEHEVSRLGVLLDETFPDADITLVSIVINPKGVTRPGVRRFSRVEEYAYFCFFGNAGLSTLGDDLLTLGAGDLEKEAEQEGELRRPRWKGLLRSGDAARREDRKDMFYPVLIDHDRRAVIDAGEPLPFESEPDFDTQISGLTPVWPVRKDGTLGRWGVGRDTLKSLIGKGYVSLGNHDPKRNSWAITYLSKEPQEQLAAGVLAVVSFDEDRNVVDVAFTDPENAARRTKTVWHRTSHDAGAGGTDVIGGLLGGRHFTFPKSVYAVRDTLELTVGDNKEALVVDFFAGSGTTAHACAMLNAKDGGNRRSIVITNNEVSVEAQAKLTERGHSAGDREWENEGIFYKVTKPRIEAAITGRRNDGTPIPEGLVNADGTPMSAGLPANVEFFDLTYLDRNEVERGKAFQAIAPLLWMEAGAKGERIETETADFAISHSAGYAILFDVGAWTQLATELEQCDDINLLFVVTDSLAHYQEIVSEVPPELTTRMLYEDYLDNFEINTGGAQ